MPMRAPYICGCGYRIASGEQCPCSRKRAQQREQRRPSARERGYDSKWDQASKAFLALPGNQRCACGCGRAADVVDHHRAHKGDQRLFWDRSNWRPMNRRCNSRKAATSEGGFGNRPQPGGRVEKIGHPDRTVRPQTREIPEN